MEYKNIKLFYQLFKDKPVCKEIWVSCGYHEATYYSKILDCDVDYFTHEEIEGEFECDLPLKYIKKYLEDSEIITTEGE